VGLVLLVVGVVVLGDASVGREREKASGKVLAGMQEMVGGSKGKVVGEVPLLGGKRR
jgi:hypothetical protein